MRESRFARELQAAQRDAASVYATGGTLVGEVDALYYDLESGEPEWIRVRSGFPASRWALVPAKRARVMRDGVHVPYGAEQVNSAPDATGDEISEADERAYFEHYGLDYSTYERDTELAEPAMETAIEPAAADVTRRVDVAEGGSVTRSEEELLIGKRPVQAGRVRLRKWVETEPVAAEVELQRETVRVVRESVDAPVEGVELRDEEIEVPVYAEQPEVEKQTVARERIALEKDVETEVQTVADELRVERVEVETEGDRPDVRLDEGLDVGRERDERI